MFFREPATNCDLGLITDPARKHGCYHTAAIQPMSTIFCLFD